VEVSPGASNEVGFPPRLARAAIDELTRGGLAILGGDIWTTANPPRPTHLNWYIQRTSQPWDEFVEEARTAAAAAIERLAREGDHLVVLVAASEGEQTRLRQSTS